jgi:hypothetical protein
MAKLIISESNSNKLVNVLIKHGYKPATPHPDDVEMTDGSDTYQHPDHKAMVHVSDNDWIHQLQPGNTNNEDDSFGSGHASLAKRLKIPVSKGGFIR